MAMHPGVFLIDHVLLPSGVCVRQAAEQLGVSCETLSAVIAGQQPVTPLLAHALAREFCGSREWWLDLQRGWDAEQRLAA